MRYFLLLLFLAACPLVYGQGLARLKKANQLYAQKDYEAAAKEYEALLNSSRLTGVMGVDAKINLADSYLKTNRPKAADRLFKEMLPYAKERPDLFLSYGETLLLLGQFTEARQQFQSYSSVRPEDPRAFELIRRCEKIEALRPLFTQVYLVEQALVNDSLRDEFAPSFYGDKGIIFVSDRIPPGDLLAELSEAENSYLQLYFTEEGRDSNLLAPRLFSKMLNTSGKHNGPASFSRDGQKVFFSQSAKARPKGGFDLQIMSSNLREDQWSKPEPLYFNLENKIFTHPCLSPDGQALYFASDMPGGQGGLDIWVSYYRGDRWTAPRNLGPKINTPANDAFPFLHVDGTLYFASKGHDGYGGYDLFRCRPMGNGIDWLDAENLGQPFNTGADDTYFLLNDAATGGYFVSAIKGSDDLYRFVLNDASPQSLPEGLSPRGSTDFLDIVDEGKLKEDEKALDELIAQGGRLQNQPSSNQASPSTPPNNNPNSEVVRPNNNQDQGNTSTTEPSPAKPSRENPNPNNTTEPSPAKPSRENPNNTTEPSPAQPNRIEENRPNGNNNSSGIVLKLELKLIDPIGGPIRGKVVLRNTLNGREESFNSDAQGRLNLNLQAEQAYELKAEAQGYYATSLPISTMGATESQTVQADLPLLKVEDN